MQDYSAHKINAHKLLKEMHLLLTKHEYEDAIECINQAIVELRMAKAAITDLKEQVQ